MTSERVMKAVLQQFIRNIKKKLIQKLSKSFYTCLFKLFDYKFGDDNPIIINEFVSKFNLFTFEHRVFSRLLSFAININTDCNSPAMLHGCFGPVSFGTRLESSLEMVRSLIQAESTTYIHYSAAEFKTKLKTELDMIFNRFSVATDKELVKFNI